MNWTRLSPALPLFFLGFAVLHSSAALADWNQWRGPDRNGIATDSGPLVDSFPEEGPAVLWESEPIPSDRDGGHGSVVVADGRAYLSLVWHRKVPTEKRQLTQRDLIQLGHRNMGSLSPELVAKAEEARKGLSARLRGKALEDWAKVWVAEHLNEEQQLSLGSHLISRFRKGRNAIDQSVLDEVGRIEGRIFENQVAFDLWLDSHDWSEEIRSEVLKVLPTTLEEGDDTVLCLDAATGETLWKRQFAGEPTGRNASSTPTVVDGKVFAVGSTSIHCLDAVSGEPHWSAPLQKGTTASSPLVVDDLVVVLASELTAYRISDGSVAWTCKDVSGIHASPVLWNEEGRPTIVCLGRKEVSGCDPATGELLWQRPGGGVSTPGFQGRHLATLSKNGGFQVLRMAEGGHDAIPLWEQKWITRRYHAAPIIHGSHVFLMGSARHLCVDLENGDQKWMENRESNISSPILADGKIWVLENRGTLSVIAADPSEYRLLAQAKLKPMACPSPTIDEGRLFLRHEDRIVCYDVERR